jgi:tetraacyldisaccharide 4'-kinase
MAKAPSWWYDEEGTPPLAARALSALYGGVVATRAALYRNRLLRPRAVAAPVVVVGNIVAGGSGKTPLTIAVVERLAREGWTPGVASRGYGRAQAGEARWVGRGDDPRLAGDEPLLIAHRTGARVRVDRDRVAAASALVDAGCNVVVCDDGLQHYRLRRDIEIEVIDGLRRNGNGRLLPAGPLREPATRARACDFHVVNLGTEGEGAVPEPGFGEWPMRLVADLASPLSGGRVRALVSFAGRRVHAVAGIGHPERFFATLRAAGIAVVPHVFEDHHAYVADDLRFGSDLPVLMTEKDAVKCAALAGDDAWSVPVRAELPEAFWVGLLEKVRAASAKGGR